MPLLLIGGGVIALLIVVIIVLGMMNGGSGDNQQRLLFRLSNLDSTMDEARRNIRSDSLGKINTETSLVISGDIVAIESLIPVKKNDKSLNAIQDEEADTVTVERLKTAALNNQHDSTYKTVLADKLQSTYELAGEVAKKSSDSKLKAALQTLQDHLTIYYEQLKTLP